MKIPFNVPYLTGQEQAYILEALQSRAYSGNNGYGKRCIELLKREYGFGEVFLTPSCTAAMEMGAILAGLEPGDEVILPSYTFSSTANAIVLQRARPIFCEVQAGTMNIDSSKITALITERTKMILPIDYAGIPCEIDEIMRIAKSRGLIVMEDAAQGFHAFHRGVPCGRAPDLAAFSFHETKNLQCGEGGALVVNRPEWVERAHFLQEKGTDRRLVLKGVQSKYSWVDKGSSFLLSDILSAMLLAQIEKTAHIVQTRQQVTKCYHQLFQPYEARGCLTIPHPPDHVQINHHAFFVILDSEASQIEFLARLREKTVSAYIGYMPLHSSPMGQKLGYRAADLPITQDLSTRLVRLPFYGDLPGPALDYALDAMKAVLEKLYDS